MFYTKKDIDDICLIHEICNRNYIPIITISTYLKIPRNRLHSLWHICKKLGILSENSLNGFEFHEESFTYWSLFGYSENWKVRYNSVYNRTMFEERGLNFSELDCDD